MLNSLLDSTNVPLLEQLAQFSERRHEVLAGNVANIDTPNYRRKDLPVTEFNDALRKAVLERRHVGVSRYSPAPPEPRSYFDDSLHVARTADPSNALFQDGAERSVEADMLAMSKNVMMQNFAVELMTNQLNLLASVIREQP